jgi:hypothetical protein
MTASVAATVVIVWWRCSASAICPRTRTIVDGRPLSRAVPGNPVARVGANTVTHLLDRKWLGQSSDPRSPAGVMANLRYDLFTTKGLRETPKEAFLSALWLEGAKQITTIIGLVLVAVILVLLGLQTGGR